MSIRSKKTFIFIISMLAVCFFGCNSEKGQKPKAKTSGKPNFIIIFADDQGYQDLGCFGSPNIRTPTIDRMAREGMRFTSFYAQTVCGPSRSALMTGCYPLRIARKNGPDQVHPNMSAEEITIAEILQDAGYTTGCFGKWDLAGHSQEDYDPASLPTKQGFDYYFGTPSSNDSYVNILRNEEMIERKADLNTLTKKYTEEVLGFIHKNQADPFFVYLPHSMPHVLLGASEDFKGKSDRGLYGDVIEEIDWSTGQILDCLKELDLDKNTYVLYTSDNGPWWLDGRPNAATFRDEGGSHGGSASPLRGYKCTTWEGGLRVPCIIWGPDRVKPNSVCDQITATLDILPTLANLAGTEIPRDRVIDGKDISGLFSEPNSQLYPERAYYYYTHNRLQAVRQGKWKLHLAYKETLPANWDVFIMPEDRVNFENPVLFDLSADIAEQHDVADKHQDVVEVLLRIADRARKDIGDHNITGENARFYNN